MSKRIAFVIILALLAPAVVAVACGHEDGSTSHYPSQHTAKWCKEFTDDPTYQPTKAGWCHRLTGTVVTVSEASPDWTTATITYIEVDYGGSDFFTVMMAEDKCNRWDPGDPFDETARLGSSGPVLHCTIGSLR